MTTALQTVDRETGEILSHPTTAVARPVLTAAAMIEAHKEVSDLITQALTPDVDYGTIPGTDRPTLLKPGAERLARAFGTVPHYEVLAREVDHDRVVTWTKRRKVWRNQFQGDKEYSWAEETGTSIGLYRFEVRCQLRRPDGAVLGEGLGVCSTMESRYVDRPRECENTALKMAQKRALVAAVLNGFGLSDRFTQDMEDAGDRPSPRKRPAPSRPAPSSDGKDARWTLTEDGGRYMAQGDGTYRVKDDLKRLGFSWDKGAKCWTTTDRRAANDASKLPGCTVAATEAPPLDEPPPMLEEDGNDDPPF